MNNPESPLIVNNNRISPHVAVSICPNIRAWCEDEGEENTLTPKADVLADTKLEIPARDKQYPRPDQVRPKPAANARLWFIFGKRSKCPWRIPWVVLGNTLIQILIFSLANRETYQLLLYSPYKKHEIWRFISYTLLHSDTIHLLLNVFLQFLTASVLETEQGHLKVLLVYLTGGLAGSLGTSIFQPALLMVGSSAGVYSLLVSHISHLAMNFSSLSLKYFRIAAVIFLCISDACFTVFHVMLRKNNDPQISIAAHISGGVSGLLLGFAVYSEPKILVLRCCKYFSMILYSVVIVVAVLVTWRCHVKDSHLTCW